MVNMGKLMKQAKSMQANMDKMQRELAERTVEFSSGGGKVVATARGDGTIAGIKIDPAVIDPDDAELLEDLVLAAVDGALGEAKADAAREMSKLTAGMGLPPGMI